MIDKNSLIVHYWDQVYIEFSDVKNPLVPESRLLFSNSFLDEKLYGVKPKKEYSKSGFKNCIFQILPGLVDNKQDLEFVDMLEAELEMIDKTNNSNKTFVAGEVGKKKKMIDESKPTLDSLNSKIMQEAKNKKLCYGMVFMLQHVESGFYLSADSSYNPLNNSMMNLKLKKEKTSQSYFKFYSYLVPSDRGVIDYESEMKLVALSNNTYVTMDKITKEIINENIEEGDPHKWTKYAYHDQFPTESYLFEIHSPS